MIRGVGFAINISCGHTGLKGSMSEPTPRQEPCASIRTSDTQSNECECHITLSRRMPRCLMSLALYFVCRLPQAEELGSVPRAGCSLGLCLGLSARVFKRLRQRAIAVK